MVETTVQPVDLDRQAKELAPLLASFGIDAVDLDMIKRGDMLGPSLGTKAFAALYATRLADTLGCDANGSGSHAVVPQNGYHFCSACGETIKAPTLTERVRAAEARLATLIASQATITRVIARARDLLERVTFDSDGVMVGFQRQGGNGGLLSTDSIKAADQLRLALEAHDRQPGP